MRFLAQKLREWAKWSSRARIFDRPVGVQAERMSAMTAQHDPLPLPNFVDWPIFPFEGDLRVRHYEGVQAEDYPRSGEPGGGPCRACTDSDASYIWADDHWRVKAPDKVPGIPVQLFLETRDHIDLSDMSPTLASEFGQLIVRLDHAIQAVGGIGRVHMSRWGDGGSHFHMWFYGRPQGAKQMLGFCLPMWAIILPPTDDDVWQRNLTIVARELARGGGAALVR